MITSEAYFQKSKLFLCPLIELPKKGDYLIDGTYLYWNKEFNIDNYNFIVTYKNNVDGFITFEKDVILKNKSLIACFEEGKLSIYIFDLSKWKDDIDLFLKGAYSKLSKNTKFKIFQYENFNSIPTKAIIENGKVPFTVHIALFPELYYEHASKELLYEDNYLKDNNIELWDIFNKEKETLK